MRFATLDTFDGRRTPDIGFLAIVGLTVVVFLTRGLTTISLGSLSIQPLPALFVLAGIFAGLAGVAGCLLGYVIPVWLLQLNVPVNAVGYLYMGVVAYALVDVLGAVEQNSKSRDTFPISVRGFLVISSVGAVGAASLSAWGYEILGQYHFFPFAILTALTLFLSVLLYAGFVVLTVGLLKPAWLRSPEDVVSLNTPEGRFEDTKSLAGTLLLFSGGWLLVGSALSAGLQIGELLPSSILRTQGLGLLAQVREFALGGVGVSTIQISLGAFVLVLWISSLRHRGAEG